MRSRIRRLMHKSDGYTSPTEIKYNGKTGTYLTCQLQRDWSKLWIGRKSGLDVLTLHMKHGQQYRKQRTGPTGPLLHYGIKIMDDGRMFDYDQLHRLAFLERKCNVRLRNQILKYIKANLKLHWRLKNA